MPDSDQPTSGRAMEIPGVRIDATIGRGGFAVVFRGHQLSLGRDVAVKVETRPLDDDRNRRRFLREATAAARINNHPHVVSLIDAGITDDNCPYLVMELCSNGSLADLLTRDGPLGTGDVVELGLAISSAVAAAHATGVLHRDIKPANILIDRYGTPRLSDFGLAALPTPGQELSVTVEALTPAYAPPEAFDNEPPTAQSDVWSLGATLYAMLVGQPPRRNESGAPLALAQLIAHSRDPFPDPEVPGSALLMPVIARATAADPNDRYADGGELHQALVAIRDRVRDEVGAKLVAGPEATFARLPARAARPRRLPVVLAAVLGLIVGAAGGFGASVATGTFRAGAGTEPPPASAATTPGIAAPVTGVCWTGLVSIENQRSATATPCTSEHSWETFAVGRLADQTSLPALVDQDPNVKATCDEDHLRSYLNDRHGSWDVYALPPTDLEWMQGSRWFSCIVSDADHTTRTKSLRDG